MRRSRLYLLVALVLFSVSVVSAHPSLALIEHGRYASDVVKADASGDGANLLPNAGEPDVGQTNGDPTSVEQSGGELRQFNPILDGLGKWASALASRFFGLGF